MLSGDATHTATWFEQMAKVRACYDDVVAHESTRGQPYDFILKLRSDLDLEKNGCTAAAFVSTLHRSVFGEPRISTHTFGPCYMNIDWGFVAPRSLAKIAFSVEEMSCPWITCLRATDPPSVPWSAGWYGVSNTHTCQPHVADSIIADWYLAHGAPFDAWATQPTYVDHKVIGQVGINHNGGCQYDSQGLGLISASQPMHSPRHVGAIKCGKDVQATTNTQALSLPSPHPPRFFTRTKSSVSSSISV